MKNLTILFALLFVCSCVNADNLFQTNNPFPQTVPQTMNNIYESEPAVIQQEQKQAKKSWFRKGKNLQQSDEQQNYIVPEAKIINEGANSSGFYVFK